jgi:hypothetical protein
MEYTVTIGCPARTSSYGSYFDVQRVHHNHSYISLAKLHDPWTIIFFKQLTTIFIEEDCASAEISPARF